MFGITMFVVLVLVILLMLIINEERLDLEFRKSIEGNKYE